MKRIGISVGLTKLRNLQKYRQMLVSILLLALIAGFGQPSLGALNSSAASSSLDISSIHNLNATDLPVEIDKSLFLSTVPAYPAIGQNYTVKVLVQNNLNTSLPIIFSVIVPFTSVIVHPFTVHYTLGPKSQVLGNFTINVFSPPQSGPVSVTAAVWIWFSSNMSHPRQIQQIGALIYGTARSPYFGVALLLVGGLAVTLTGVAVFLIRKATRAAPSSHRIASNPPQGAP